MTHISICETRPRPTLTPSTSVGFLIPQEVPIADRLRAEVFIPGRFRNAMQQIRIHLVPRDKQASPLLQDPVSQSIGVPCLLFFGRCISADGLVVEFKHNRCAQAYCGDDGVVCCSVFMWHDPLARAVLVYQHMIRCLMW